jgi:hypothetical protein
MLIDRQTGIVRLSEDNHVSHSTTVEEFLETAIGKEASPWITREDFRSFMLPTLTYEGYFFGGHLIFHEQKLSTIWMGFSVDNIQRSWDDWNLIGEIAHKRLHDKILMQELGKPDAYIDIPEEGDYKTRLAALDKSLARYNFRWGVVSSCYDKRTDCCRVIINWVNPHTWNK